MKFNKYKHKQSDWITQGILQSMRFRDTLYRRMKHTPTHLPNYTTLKNNLKVYNRILRTIIKEAKAKYYELEFAKYNRDIKKTWDIIKSVINRETHYRNLSLKKIVL